MVSSRSELADDVCPISDDLLGELHRANDLLVPGFVSALPPDVRALLALFCYRRSHLHSMGLGIAASCDKDNLVHAGGSVGAFLFGSSRELPSHIAFSPRGNRRKITLATGVLRMFANDEMGPTDPPLSVDMASSEHSSLRRPNCARQRVQGKRTPPRVKSPYRGTSVQGNRI
jgi:hypothetical protein